VEHSESAVIPEATRDQSRQTQIMRRSLLLAAVLASICVVPYTYSFMKQRARELQPASALISDLAANVLIEVLISWGLILLGMRARRSLGLDAALLKDWPPADDRAWRRVRNSITLAFVLGLGLGLILAIADYFVEPMMPKPRRPLPTPPPWTGLLASVGAGIQEELWMRLGMMTFLVWLRTRIVRRTPPRSAVVWTANAFAALLFGALHVPQALVLVGPSAIVVAFTLIGNGVPGMVFGWLYWPFGMIAAMVCHFSADLLLKAILPLLGIAGE
jgi:membrane protease YdiL (CAAX protease family)